MITTQRTLLTSSADRRREVILHRKSYLQPFERKLALAELGGLGLSCSRTERAVGTIHLSLRARSTRTESIGVILNRLTYFDWVSTDKVRPTRQAARESAGLGAGQPRTALPNRRVLRYAPHDLHEYRGKFFPQLVRSLCNTAGLVRNNVVLDPMCGSGTSLVEARALDMVAVGLDRNPLSVLVTKVKTDCIGWEPGFVERVRSSVRHSMSVGPHERPAASWSAEDEAYLLRWFDPRALEEIAGLQAALESLAIEPMRDFARVCLSDVLRGVSYQNLEDLRVRKKVTRYVPGTVRTRFSAKLESALHGVERLLSVDSGHETPFRVVCGDATNLTGFLPDLRGRVDLAITSPPYATALPYLDTDRLSLIVLGLLPRGEHRGVEAQMIGTREITERDRIRLWRDYESRRSDLPDSATHLIDRLERIYSEETTGFRRRNLPSLLATYLLRMQRVLTEVRVMLRNGAIAFVVVGNNSTRSNGERIEIPTDSLLSEIASGVGFVVGEPLNMELLTSRDIFSKNRGSREQLLRFVAG